MLCCDVTSRNGVLDISAPVTITGNEARYSGGAISNFGTVTLPAAADISGNTATLVRLPCWGHDKPSGFVARLARSREGWETGGVRVGTEIKPAHAPFEKLIYLISNNERYSVTFHHPITWSTFILVEWAYVQRGSGLGYAAI